MITFRQQYLNFEVFKTKINHFKAGLISAVDGELYNYLFSRFNDNYVFINDDTATIDALIYKKLGHWKMIFIELIGDNISDIKKLIEQNADSSNYTGDQSNKATLDNDINQFLATGASNKFKPSILSVFSNIVSLNNQWDELEKSFLAGDLFSQLSKENTEIEGVDLSIEQETLLQKYTADLMIDYLEANPEKLTNIKGDKGDKGSKGDKGDKGEKGDIGHTGPTGRQGPQGPQGRIGPQGLQGYDGNKGERGDTGPRGYIGPLGPKGDKGDKGDAGSATIADGSITTAKIKNLAITNSKVGLRAITRSKIGNTAVGTDQLGSKSVSLAKLGDDTTNLHNSHIQRIDGNKNKIDVLENKYDTQGKLKLQYYQAGSGSFDGSAINDGTIKSNKLSNSGNFDSGYPLRFNSQGDFNTFAIDEAHLTDAVKNKLNKAGSGSGGSPIIKENSNSYFIKHPTINTEAILYINKTTGKMYFTKTGKQYCYIDTFLDLCDDYNNNRLVFNEASYFNYNSNFLTGNNVVSTATAKIGYRYKGNAFIGENMSGGLFIGYNSTGALSIGDNITGSMAIAHNSTGALVIGSTKNQALSKIVSPSGEARFNEIIDMVRHEKNHVIEQQELVLWAELKKILDVVDYEKDLFTTSPLTYTTDQNSDVFAFNFNNNLPGLGMPLGDLVFEFFLQTTTADNFNLFLLDHLATMGQTKQHGSSFTGSDWTASGHILKDFDLQGPMKIRVEVNNMGKDKRLKINAVRYCQYGASVYNRRWYEFKSAGAVRFIDIVNDDNFTVSFELRKMSGSGYTTLKQGSTIKVYKMGTK